MTALSQTTPVLCAGSPRAAINLLNPLEIATDGSGTVFHEHSWADRLIVEITDPGRRPVSTTSVAELTHADISGGQATEIGADAR